MEIDFAYVSTPITNELLFVKVHLINNFKIADSLQFIVYTSESVKVLSLCYIVIVKFVVLLHLFFLYSSLIKL
jgi:hypothetical protein